MRSGAGGHLFLALLPGAAAAARMHRLAIILKGAHGFGREPVERDRLHVSLFFLGLWSERTVRLAHEAAAEMRIQPFEVLFDRSVSFRGKDGSYPFVLVGDDGSKALKGFRRMLSGALARKGLGSLARGDFTPHITLFYGEREIDEYPIQPPIGWRVDEFALIHSLRGHTHLARWRFDV
jgi:RNA 2',3'-cyclic 3'-phosphodiesterase